MDYYCDSLNAVQGQKDIKYDFSHYDRGLQKLFKGHHYGILSL